MSRGTRLPRNVLALGLVSLLTDAGSEMIFPLLPVFLTEVLGAGPRFLGMLEGLADAIASLLKLASGYVADRARRRKPLVVFGYALASAVRPLVAVATAPWHVLVVRATDRVGKGVRSSPRDALIAESVDTARAGRAFGFHRAMDHAGAVLGPLFATGLLALGLGLRSVFWWAAVPGALAVVVVVFLVREQHVAAEAAPAGAHAAPAAQATRAERVRLGSFLAILFVFALGNSSDAFLLLRARELGVAEAAIPLLWAVLHVSKMVSSYLGGGLSDRVGRVPLVIAGWVVYAGVYLGFGLARTEPATWGLFVIYGLYYGLTEPAEKALVRDVASRGRRGRAFGWYNFVTGISAVPAGLLTGVLWKAWGAPVALGVGAALAALASAGLAAWAVGARPAEPRAAQR